MKDPNTEGFTKYLRLDHTVDLVSANERAVVFTFDDGMAEHITLYKGFI